MHYDLAWIVSARCSGPETAAGSDSWNQSCPRAIGEVHAAHAATRRTVEFGVIEEVGDFSGNLQVNPLGNGKGSANAGVDVGFAGQANIAVGLRRISDPIDIRNNISVRCGQRLALERAQIVFKVGVFRWSNASPEGGRNGVFPYCSRKRTTVPTMYGLSC